MKNHKRLIAISAVVTSVLIITAAVGLLIKNSSDKTVIAEKKLLDGITTEVKEASATLPDVEETDNISTEQEKSVEEVADPIEEDTDIQDEETLPEEDEEQDFIQRPDPVKVRGLYLTGPVAGTESIFEPLYELAKANDVNSFIIDVKSDDGIIPFKNEIAVADEIEATVNYVKDMRAFVKRLNDDNFYTIARIVVFKDPFLPTVKPELAIKTKDGDIWYDRKNDAWVNPYDRRVWDYVLEIAKSAVDMGFKEIQFDYIRFSTDGRMVNADFGELAEGISRTDIITDFTKYAYETLAPLGVYVSADVFGTIIFSDVDRDIVGQDYLAMSKHLDYICPMIYPSHFADGTLGIAHPDTMPYDIILKTLELSNEKLQDGTEDRKAIVRPWLQAFTATWLKNYISYGKAEIEQQIKAVNDAGLDEWILWDASNRYKMLQ